MTRPTKDRYLMNLAEVAATRTTCIRRGVGCVLADAKGRVLAIAYNGVAAGQPHCNEATHYELKGLKQKGTGLPAIAHLDDAHVIGIPKRKVYGNACAGYDRAFGEPTCCEAVHAEQNAVIQCRDASAIHTAYVTVAPCKPCAKLLLNTGCRRIVFLEDHPGSGEAREIWEKAGREWTQLSKEE